MLLALSGTCYGFDFDLRSILSPNGRKKAEKVSEDMNDFIKGANELAGEEVITPLEDREGMGRLFFTVTPTPSVSPTPSTTPSPSITPTSSVSPSISATPSVSRSKTGNQHDDVGIVSLVGSVRVSPNMSATPSVSRSKTGNQNDDVGIISQIGSTLIHSPEASLSM